MPDKTALVTGASGMIGRCLCTRLQSQGWYVIALNRTLELGPWHQVSIWDAKAEGVNLSSFGRLDALFHLAGKAHALDETVQDDGEYFAINAEGTRKLLETARATGVRSFVFFSSVKAMGEGSDICIDESKPCHPETSYGKSKLAAEKLVLEGDYVHHPVVIRPSMVYGNTEKGNLPKMIKAIGSGKFPPLPEVGNRRSMVHVDDVVQAAILAAEHAEAAGQTYIVTDGESYSTRQMYEWICEALHKPLPVWNLPLFVLKLLAKVGDLIGALRGRRFVFDSDGLDKLTGSASYSSAKIERQLGFKANRNLREALPEIAQYLGVLK